jgi:stage II sporulation protein AA (anti-sigma F factor antagonist)
MGFEVQRTDHGEVTILALSGELDSRAAPDLEGELLGSLSEDRGSLLLDFAQLDFISSAGLRVLVMVSKRLAAEGGGLVLCGLNPEVQRVFDIVGMSEFFPIKPRRAEAIQWLAKSVRTARICSLAEALLRQNESGAAGVRSRSSLGSESRRSSLAAELLGAKGGVSEAHPSGTPSSTKKLD